MTNVNLSEANAWRSLDKWFKEFIKDNPTAKEIQSVVSDQLSRDGCYSAWIHHAHFIERLVEIIEEQRDELAYYEKV